MADVELSAAHEDRLKAVLAKLAAAQHRLESTLGALLLKLPPRTSHHYLSSHYAFVSALSFVSIPKTVQEALSHRGWQQVMIDEMQAPKSN